MKIIKSLVATLIGTCLCGSALAQQGDFHRKLYIGGAGGVSKVEPEIRGGQNLEVTDDESEGGKVYIGWDFRPHMALELGYADLGEAEIGPNNIGEVEYEVAAVSYTHLTLPTIYAV